MRPRVRDILVIKEETMKRWKCTLCEYIYDPKVGDPTAGVKPGIAFENLPADWVCPDCGADKDAFEELKD